MAARFPALACALAVACGIALAGCGDGEPGDVPTPLVLGSQGAPGTDSDLADLSPEQLVERIASAVREAGPVHMVGSYTEPPPVDEDGRTVESPATAPRTLTVDVRGTPDRCSASFTSAGVAAKILRRDADVYVTGNQALAASLGEPRVAAGWVRYDAADRAIAPWLTLTNVPGLVASVLTARPDVTFARGSTVATPEPRLQVEISSRGTLAGTVTVAAEGPPLPSSIAVTDPTGTGDLRFSRWAEPFVPVPPEDFSTSEEG